MSECELPQFYEAKEVIARKNHKCIECKSLINRNEKYLKCTGKWSLGIETYKQHLLCWKACEMVRDNFNGTECIGFGELFEWLNEYDSLKYKKTESDVKEFRTIIAKIIKRQRS